MAGHDWGFAMAYLCWLLNDRVHTQIYMVIPHINVQLCVMSVFY